MHRHGLLQLFFLHVLSRFNKSGQFWWLLRVGIYFIIRYVNICLSYKPYILFSWQALEGVCKHGWAAQPEQQPAEEKAALAHPGHPNHPADTRRNTHTRPGETTVVIYKFELKKYLWSCVLVLHDSSYIMTMVRETMRHGKRARKILSWRTFRYFAYL